MDNLDTLVVDVRASTDGFAADIGKLRNSFDSILVDGFARAGNTLERSLSGAIRKGGLDFEDLGRVATRVLDDIAAQALRSGLGAIGLGSSDGGIIGGGLAALVTSVLGLPGRATGGPVSPGQAYMVGERGPEVFVPTAAGRVETTAMGQPRSVNVSIRVVAPAGSSQPESLRRSSRQVAQAVRRAIGDN